MTEPVLLPLAASAIGGLIGACGGFLAAGRSIRFGAKRAQRRAAGELSRAVATLHGAVRDSTDLPVPFSQRHVPAAGKERTRADAMAEAVAVWEAERLTWGPDILDKDVWRMTRAVAEVATSVGFIYGLDSQGQQNVIAYLWFVRSLLIEVAEGNRFRGTVPLPDVGETPVPHREAVYWFGPVLVHLPWRPRTRRLWSGGNLGIPLPATSPMYPTPGWVRRCRANTRVHVLVPIGKVLKISTPGRKDQLTGDSPT